MKRVIYKVEETVIALNNPANAASQQRVKGQLYKVLDFGYCSKCGEQMININTDVPAVDTLECECGHVLGNNNKKWTLSRNFAPVDNKTLKELVNKEEYELAKVIQDYLQEQPKVKEHMSAL